MDNGFLVKAISIVTSFFILISSCISCAPAYLPTGSPGDRNIWDPGSDYGAKQAQKIMKTAVKINIGIVVDTTELNIMGVVDTNEKEVGSSGSGTVVYKKNGKSLVLTAQHVCDVPEVLNIRGFDLKVLSVTRSVVRVDGVELTARIIEADESTDTCTLLVDGDAGNVAVLADELPPIGAVVYYAGAPTGYWAANQIPFFSGYFSGIVTEKEDLLNVGDIFFTCPVYGGASGSGLFYNGKVIGVVRVYMPKFHVLAFAASLAATKRIVKDSIGKM